MNRFAYLLFSLLLPLHIQAAGITSWNIYRAYADITEIEPAGNTVFVLSSGSLFAYRQSDNSIQLYDKIRSLSDSDIAHIAWCQSARRLIIVYQNQNIDLLSPDGSVINISSLYTKLMTEDKTVNAITVVGSSAYLSTGFGIVKINVERAEISDTYYLGVSATSVALTARHIYATTRYHGLFSARLTDNLLDRNRWTQDTSHKFSQVFSLNGTLYAFNDGESYVWNGTIWNRFANLSYNRAFASADRILLTRTDGFYAVSNADNHPHFSWIDNSLSTLSYDPATHLYWGNRSDGSLCSFTIKDNLPVLKTDGIKPDGPQHNTFGFLKFTNGALYSCSGGYGSNVEMQRPGTVQVLRDGSWTVFQDDLAPLTGHKYEDLVTMDADPNNPAHVFAGGKTGLYEFLNGKFVHHYTLDNSPLKSALASNSKDYVLTESVLFDKKGGLWVLNSQAPSTSLLYLSPAGEWSSFHRELLEMPTGRSHGALQGLMTDSRNLLWFYNNHWEVPSFYYYRRDTDVLKQYKTFVNQDGTAIAVKYARCMAEDKEGNLWFGTDAGPLLLRQNQIANANDEIFTQIKIPRNDGTNYADYLLDGVDINCMAIDGAGRKWFGTRANGVYLISADNMKQLHHFTTSNSKLLSDEIEAIAINGTTGEVFFGTGKGLCSYMSDATTPAETMSDDTVYAYPNPVRPDYTGLITVTGLTFETDVKIVTAAGTLVAEGTSNGGTFTWDGKDRNGRRVASGVYMVLTATSDGNKGVVCKIAVVN